LPGDGNYLRIALEFSRESTPPQLAEAVIAPPLVIQLWRWPIARFLDQSICQHAFERAIERAGAHLDLLLAILIDLLHNLIAVLLAARKREQDVEHRWGERDERFFCLHVPKYTSVTDICQGGGTERSNRLQNTFLKMLDIARTGDVIVVWRLDRLGRSLKQLIETVTMLGERCIELRSLKENIDTTTSTGKLMFYIIGAMAEFERDVISERTQAGLDAAAGILGGKNVGTS
jgi:Resolvase, N terminal domain